MTHRHESPYLLPLPRTEGYLTSIWKPVRGWWFALAIFAIGVTTQPPAAQAHTKHRFGVLFHDATIEEARQMATNENKLLLLYACKPGIPPAEYFERATLDDWALVDLLVRETVPLKIAEPTASPHTQTLKPNELPAILLIDASGRKHCRLPGDLSAQTLHARLASVLSDDAAVGRAKRAVESGIEPLAARERLAYTLSRRGDFAAATQEFTWLTTVALCENANFSTARRDAIIDAFARLSKHHPPAAKALNAWRTSLEEQLEKNDSAHLARNLATLNEAMGTRDRTLVVYDRLQKSRRVRHVLFDRVIDELVATGRHDEVLRILDPQQAFRQELRLATRRGGTVNPGTTDKPIRGTLPFVLNRGAILVEALAAANRLSEAQQLIDEVLRTDNSEPTQALLKTHVKRAGKPQLIEHIKKMASTLPTSQPATAE